MIKPRSYFIVAPLTDIKVKCACCLAEEPAVGILRVNVPENEEMSRFMDVQLCSNCAEYLREQLKKIIHLPAGG